MRLTPFAVWAHKLPKAELFIAVKVQTMLTHLNDIAIEASYLYCYAISLMLNGHTSEEAFNMTKREVVSETIREWFE